VEAEKFNVRVGLNTGSVIIRPNDILGDTVNVASRMETSADPGEVRLTQRTYKAIKDHVRCTYLGPIQVKGKADPIAAYSAEEALIDVAKLLAKGRDTEGPDTAKAGAGSLANLKESMFEPQFKVSQSTGLDQALLGHLQGLFTDLTGAIEKVSDDYHEEYLFKRLLQERWDRLMASVGKRQPAE
jgi:hypothetical protein